MAVNIRTGGASGPTSDLPTPVHLPVSLAGGSIHYAVVDIETFDGVKTRGDRDKFIKTSKFLCASVYDSETSWTYNYGPETFDRLISHLESVDIVITFNGKGYDIPVLENVLGRKLGIKCHMDLFEMIVQVTQELRGYGLDNVSKKTLGYGKIGIGTHAAELRAKAELGGPEAVDAVIELLTYCAHDVRLTRELLKFAQTYKFLIGPGGPVHLMLPSFFERLA